MEIYKISIVVYLWGHCIQYTILFHAGKQAIINYKQSIVYLFPTIIDKFNFIINSIYTATRFLKMIYNT